jgi:hypothetical protein
MLSFRGQLQVSVLHVIFVIITTNIYGATIQKRYYAHDAVEDRYGVIAPWYKGQNGQFDFRVRIAAETLKRYPWVDTDKAPLPAPEYVYNGHWKITFDGTISAAELRNWNNGDYGQRAAYVLGGFIDYYRYSGDPGAIAHIHHLADVLLNYCQTDDDHPWPKFFISVPIQGKLYSQCDSRGMIQLDIVAQVGFELVRAYELTGNSEWLAAAKHWGDLLAANRNRDRGLPPWNRYANPEQVPWEDHQTGGVCLILMFLDELIRVGYVGENNAIVEARDAGRDHLADVLLGQWTVHDTWGRNYWDWPCNVQDEVTTDNSASYILSNPDYFKNWRIDARNIISLFLNRTSVNPKSNGDVYHGAWAYPESSGCCGRSLWYAPLQIAHVFARYGVLADSEWSREQARRQMILTTYDFHKTGVVEDNIDGGQIVAGSWFKIAHPMALKHVLSAMAWLPEVMGANRENHIMRSSSVVNSVVYGKDKITYSVFDAPAETIDVLRLAFKPDSVTTDGKGLSECTDLKENGYTVKGLKGGDFMVSIRHDGSKNIVIKGNDPQQEVGAEDLAYTGNWKTGVSSSSDSSMSYTFEGNQVRLIGSVGPTGGLADVYVDDVKQLVGIDCWNPKARQKQVLYYKNGLDNQEHTLKIVVRGEKNLVSRGSGIDIDWVQYSSATGDSGFGEGGGPTETQRVIFGYTERDDYVDSKGNTWRPGMEFIIRLGHGVDSVAGSWWTNRRRMYIAGTDDQELYRYGVHGKQFSVYFTVAPENSYHVRLKFAETRRAKPQERGLNIHINDKEVVTKMDIAATAGGLNRAVDLVFNNVRPKRGIIDIRFTGTGNSEAIIQAIEVGTGDGGKGATPIRIPEAPAEKKTQ